VTAVQESGNVRTVPESFLAVCTTEAGFVVDDISRPEPLCSVHPLVARHARLSVRRLYNSIATTTTFIIMPSSRQASHCQNRPHAVQWIGLALSCEYRLISFSWKACRKAYSERCGWYRHL